MMMTVVMGIYVQDCTMKMMTTGSLTELTFIPNSCSIFSLTAMALSAFSCLVARRASST